MPKDYNLNEIQDNRTKYPIIYDEGGADHPILHLLCLPDE